MKVLRLQVRNTGKFMTIDPLDWDNVKDVFWYEYKNKICCRNGLTYEEFVGLKGMKHRDNILYNKIRDQYIPEDMTYIYNEYKGVYEIVKRRN